MKVFQYKILLFWIGGLIIGLGIYFGPSSPMTALFAGAFLASMFSYLFIDYESQKSSAKKRLSLLRTLVTQLEKTPPHEEFKGLRGKQGDVWFIPPSGFAAVDEILLMDDNHSNEDLAEAILQFHIARNNFDELIRVTNIAQNFPGVTSVALEQMKDAVVRSYENVDKSIQVLRQEILKALKINIS